jgi:hypothetical protein
MLMERWAWCHRRNAVFGSGIGIECMLMLVAMTLRIYVVTVEVQLL